MTDSLHARIIKIICAGHPGCVDTCETCYVKAYGILQEFLKPTDEMIDVGITESHNGYGAERIWNAMIEQALLETRE